MRYCRNFPEIFSPNKLKYYNSILSKRSVYRLFMILIYFLSKIFVLKKNNPHRKNYTNLLTYFKELNFMLL